MSPPFMDGYTWIHFECLSNFEAQKRGFGEGEEGGVTPETKGVKMRDWLALVSR